MPSMKRIISAVVGLLLAVTAHGLTLKNGRTLESVQVLGYEKEQVILRHQEGSQIVIEAVPRQWLPEDWRRQVAASSTSSGGAPKQAAAKRDDARPEWLVGPLIRQLPNGAWLVQGNGLPEFSAALGDKFMRVGLDISGTEKARYQAWSQDRLATSPRVIGHAVLRGANVSGGAVRIAVREVGLMEVEGKMLRIYVPWAHAVVLN